jgi:hypothetical protein
MRRVVNALCFALAFAIPVCVGAVAYPFRTASPYLDANSAFQLFCFYAFAAGVFGGAIYSATLAYCKRHASIAKSLLSGVLTLVIIVLFTILLTVLFDAAPHPLRSFGFVAAITVCPVLCGFLLSGSGLTVRSTRTLTGTATPPPHGPVN